MIAPRNFSPPKRPSASPRPTAAILLVLLAVAAACGITLSATVRPAGAAVGGATVPPPQTGSST